MPIPPNLIPIDRRHTDPDTVLAFPRQLEPVNQVGHARRRVLWAEGDEVYFFGSSWVKLVVGDGEDGIAAV